MTTMCFVHTGVYLPHLLGQKENIGKHVEKQNIQFWSCLTSAKMQVYLMADMSILVVQNNLMYLPGNFLIKLRFYISVLNSVLYALSSSTPFESTSEGKGTTLAVPPFIPLPIRSNTSVRGSNLSRVDVADTCYADKSTCKCLDPEMFSKMV